MLCLTQHLHRPEVLLPEERSLSPNGRLLVLREPVVRADVLLDGVERRQRILLRPEGLSRLPAQRILQLGQGRKPVLDPGRRVSLASCLGIDLAANEPAREVVHMPAGGHDDDDPEGRPGHGLQALSGRPGPPVPDLLSHGQGLGLLPVLVGIIHNEHLSAFSSYSALSANRIHPAAFCGIPAVGCRGVAGDLNPQLPRMLLDGVAYFAAPARRIIGLVAGQDDSVLRERGRETTPATSG